MKNIILIASLSLTVSFTAPLSAFAHGSVGAGTEFNMMQSIEDEVLGDELHQEMESLMVKMMNDNMTDVEFERMTELMQTYPGPYGGMMMRHMMGAKFAGNQSVNDREMMGGYSMMPWGGGMTGFGSFWAWILGFASLAWLLVGILAVIWLWKQIAKQ